MSEDPKSDEKQFNETLKRMLGTPPQPKKPEKPTAKREKRKSSDRVVSPKGKAKQSE